ncbi:hypothetical protein ACTFIV_000002, partial [Dictyostelium citrinum]
NVKWMKKKKI